MAEGSAYAERTVLAWQRTSLAILTGALVQLRLSAGEAPLAALVLLGLAAVAAIRVLAPARER